MTSSSAKVGTSPDSPPGRRLLAHELAHISQQGPWLYRQPEPGGDAAQRPLRPHDPRPKFSPTGACYGSAICKDLVTPSKLLAEVEGDPENEAKRESRRQACEKRPPDPACTADGHGAVARETAKLLHDYDASRPAPGVKMLVDKDLPARFRALTILCDRFMPPVTGATDCITVPDTMEQQAAEFNNTMHPDIGGEERGKWRERTLEKLVHESEHTRFRAAHRRGEFPAIMLSGCATDDTMSAMNELSAMLTEFALRMERIRTSVGLSPEDREKELDEWREHRILGTKQSITVSLRTVRCACNCDEANRMIREAVEFTTASWTQQQKNELHREMRDPRWSDLDLGWPFVAPPVPSVSLSTIRTAIPLQRKCSCGGSAGSTGAGEECQQKKEEPTVQRKAAGTAGPTFAPPIVREVVSSPGQPLDRASRKFFEPHLGHDLSAVRVHSDSLAAESARAVHARSYTVGNHIAFAEGEFAPWTSDGRTLLAHELVHVAQQADGAPAPIHLARAEAPYTSPYNEALAAELLERLRQLRIAQGGASAVAQSKRVGAVAAVFDRQGNRLATIEHMNVPNGAHAEELVVQDIQNRIAAGQRIEYTVLMVDQDPCPGTCSPLLKEWRGNPASGTTRVVTPMAVSKADPSSMVSGKTAYKRALTQDTVPFEPKTPPPNNAAFVGTRQDLSRVRLPLAKDTNPVPAAGTASDVTADVTGDPASAAAKALGRTGEQAAEHELEDAAAARVTRATTQAAEKDLAETASEALTKTATTKATGQLGKAVAPVIGAAFAAPDAWKGIQDLSHGDLFLGLGTIGVAIIDVASQGLHLTDEITAGGGTILAITIQTWAATMQFAFESARISKRASELKAYVKAHGNRLPPRDELISYYGLNDEDILILENDIYQAQQNKVTTEALAKQVQGLLTQIDANANKPLPEGVTPEGIQKERAELSTLLVALKADVEQKRSQAAKERAAAEEKRRQANFDRAQQQQTQAPTARAASQLLPAPGVSRQQTQQQGVSADPFSILAPTSAQPLNGISMESAEIVATGFGRTRNALLARYMQLESEHFPSEKVQKYQGDVTAYVSALDRMIGQLTRKGSGEWPGVKEMGRLRDAADNEDRSKLMR